jgi:hypothetical protein
VRSSILFRVLIVILLLLTVFAIFRYFNIVNPLTWLGKGSISPTPAPIQRAAATISVNGTQWGVSTCYIGAVEGSSRFNIADLQDLGINTYLLYGGMSRWESRDDSGIYGYPTIDQIKANPNVINWSWWDSIMTSPPGGSDYWWDADGPRWQGNARTLFSTLKAAHIRTVISLRNRDDEGHPSWSPNPPVTNADWNEWWEHVFATVYWLNVRNDYRIDDFEIANEPNISNQGWGGSEVQYFTFARYTYDAISYVYRTYLPGRVFHVYAPATSLGRDGGHWPEDAIYNISSYFDSMAIHLYDTDITNYVEQVHGWLNQAGYPNEPVWLTEWGSFSDRYDSVPFGISLINNLIDGSRPGNDYVYGSHIFALYDYDTHPYGLISYKGVRRADYYAMRMGIRALQGCRPTYQSSTSSSSLQAMTTRDKAGNTYLLATNQDNTTWYDVDADLSSLMTGSTGKLWEFDAEHMDTPVGSSKLNNGHVSFTIPANGAILIEFPANSSVVTPTT